MFDAGNPADMVYVHDEVILIIKSDKERIKCIIPREVIEDKFGLSGEEGEAFRIAKENFDVITDILMHKAAIGDRKPDGSIMLSLSDWR